MSFPLACALPDRFASDPSEISTGKLVRFVDPDTWLLLIVISFRYVHAPLYQPGPLSTLKLAVTLAGPVMIRFCGIVPDSAPLKPMNWSPGLAVALIGTDVPLFTHSLAGLMVPSFAGFAVVVSIYCVVNVAVYVVDEEGAVTGSGDPAFPVQLENTYCVPVVPACVAARSEE